MNYELNVYWIWLASASGIGAVTARRLLDKFGSPDKVYEAGASDYRGVAGLRLCDAERLMNKSTDESAKAEQSCIDRGYRIITLNDDEYPERLKNIYDPPVIFYVSGSLPPIDDEPAVGIVGTRNSTLYGDTEAEKAGHILARSGIIVVTGLARGIDTSAARGALRGGGRVIGVIGSGLDIVYPGENRALFDEVSRKGAIISEYPPGTQPAASHFPARNRLISGLSLGVAVIEAPRRSGALLTAARALEQGRDVFTLPGNVGEWSCEGSNALLREGAIPFLCGEDIVMEYAGLFPEISIPGTQEEPSRFAANNGKNDEKKLVDIVSAADYIDLSQIYDELDGAESLVAQAIGPAGSYTDDMIVSTDLSAKDVLSALTMLEIKGIASRDKSGKWKLLKVQEGMNINAE